MFTQNIHANTRSQQQLACHCECYNRADRTKFGWSPKIRCECVRRLQWMLTFCGGLKSYIRSLIVLPVWSRQVRS